ncbi:bifunctional methylenetetrahydrofolate dehydrogenase/methenyltetrahydrofolate cyclohydrolase FolD [Proteinivorax hydrogeniformans]|uniref:Bifunctional protein FolD n=1 Tax=Proteinivorax hydrogeniformans TaxID=1826727 RepID=A0AAU8HRV8_9FIRM
MIASKNLLDGKSLAKKIRGEVKEEILDIKKSKGITPGLTVIIVGEDPASQAYVSKKEKAAKKLGINSKIFRLPETTSEDHLLKLIHRLNNEQTVDGILVQLPLPDHIDKEKVIDAISPEKDVDGFHTINAGKMFLNKDTLLPCTPYGVLKLLESEDVSLEGKHVVVVGASDIVGKPMAMLALNQMATITICHIATKDLAYHTRQADIIIVAVGKVNLITEEMVKDGAVVVDVGINRLEDRLVGDVDFENVSKKASLITPVPGGVGPMTIAMLMYNTLLAMKERRG